MAEQKDYSGIGQIIKWSAIGIAVLGAGATAGYVFIKKGIKNNKRDKAYAGSTAIDSKGKTTATVGTGKTAAAYATLIHAALKATVWNVPNTDEEAVYKNLKELQTQYEVALVSTAYEPIYGKTLNQALDEDLDDDEFAIAINIITAKPTGSKK